MSESSLPKAPDPAVDPAAYLRSIYAVRARTSLVLSKAKKDELKHFHCDMNKFPDAAEYVVSIIKRDFAPDFTIIPPHGRWQHFDVGGTPRIDQMMSTWSSSLDDRERTRRLLDLFLVSVLLDAGAGNKWKYTLNHSKESFGRSEGLAVASLEMFQAGLFSSNEKNPYQVDGAALRDLTVEKMAQALQVSKSNPIDGLEGRTNLLIRLGDAMKKEKYFGTSGRPGHMIDYLAPQDNPGSKSSPIIALPTLWDMLMDGLGPIWPATRTQINGTSLGDAWPCSSMPEDPEHAWKNIVPFHKLTQWLTYSLMVPIQKLLNVQFEGADLMTGLPEYRNGGLFVDTGVLTLRDGDMERGLSQEKTYNKDRTGSEVVPFFTADDNVVVEWRAVTVGLLDDMLAEVNSRLGLNGKDQLNLAQMLEAGSWKGGREIAKVKRPASGGPPIMIQSDGTVF